MTKGEAWARGVCEREMEAAAARGESEEDTMERVSARARRRSAEAEIGRLELDRDAEAGLLPPDALDGDGAGEGDARPMLTRRA